MNGTGYEFEWKCPPGSDWGPLGEGKERKYVTKERGHREIN